MCYFVDNGLVNDWFCFPDIVGEHFNMEGSVIGTEDRTQSGIVYDIRFGKTVVTIASAKEERGLLPCHVL